MNITEALEKGNGKARLKNQNGCVEYAQLSIAVLWWFSRDGKIEVVSLGNILRNDWLPYIQEEEKVEYVCICKVAMEGYIVEADSEYKCCRCGELIDKEKYIIKKVVYIRDIGIVEEIKGFQKTIEINDPQDKCEWCKKADELPRHFGYTPDSPRVKHLREDHCPKGGCK